MLQSSSTERMCRSRWRREGVGNEAVRCVNIVETILPQVGLFPRVVAEAYISKNCCHAGLCKRLCEGSTKPGASCACCARCY